MLNPGSRRRSLAGRLLLSGALVAVSLAYGWWQRHSAAGPNMATAPTPATPNRTLHAQRRLAVTPPAAPVTEATRDASSKLAAAPKSASVAPLQKKPPAGQSEHDASLPASASAAPLTALAMLRMHQPPPPQMPLALIIGTPAPGAAAPIPQGTHLEDGDYLSDTQQFEWGDLQVKISVHGGQITGAQLTQYPDHRAESLQISQMASPILNSEVIQTQQAKVDIVSSATDTSYVYRDAVASAIIKATRP